jgi:serine protease
MPTTPRPARRRRRAGHVAVVALSALVGALLTPPGSAQGAPRPATPPGSAQGAPGPGASPGTAKPLTEQQRTAAIGALRDRVGKAGLGTVGAALDADLAAAAVKDPCASATNLQRYADDVGAAAARQPVLLRDGARLRAEVLAAVPAGAGCEGPVTVYVDPDEARPRSPQPPPWQDRVARPVAGVTDSSGVHTDLVANELTVSSPDRAVADAVAARWGGAVVAGNDPKLRGFVPLYLVRVDPTRADPTQLSGLLAKLDRGRTRADALAVSGADGLGLLTIAATEAVNGLKIGVNWLASPDAVADGSTSEAPTGPGGFLDTGGGYSPNAYTWSYLDSGSTQDIGAAPAWTLLDSVDRTGNTVEVGIVDKGFRPDVNGDLPAGTTMTSVVPFVSADSSGDSVAPWHGTSVADTAAGVPDNGRGAAGSSGPVGRLRLVYSSYDYFTAIAGITTAVGGGSKIVNMSFGASVHWALEWTVLPFEAATATIRGLDILLFASAGNDGRDVDSETCFITCWEDHWVTPCENDGVSCVGGLARNSLLRDGNSNYGHEDVDVFAPFRVISGPTPDNGGNHSVSGTSFASPYAAGVAALIWAADPAQSGSAVETKLLAWMRTSPDGNVGRRVINALGPVRDALPPAIAIKTPGNGAQLGAGTPTQFRATVYADGHGTPAVTWKRGTTTLGTGAQITASLPPGTHTVTATATFPDGVSVSDSIQVTVANHAPAVHIVTPDDTSVVPVFSQGEAIPFAGTSLDIDTGPLADNQVSWRLDGSATPFATGHNATAALPAGPGQHTVTFRGCDAFGQCGTDTVTLLIQPAGPNQPPSVAITNPADGAVLQYNGSDANGVYHQLTLGSSVSDPEGGPLTLVWTDSRAGGPAVQIGTGPSPTVKLYGGCGAVSHRITLTVTDNAGNVRQRTVEVSVLRIC